MFINSEVKSEVLSAISGLRDDVDAMYMREQRNQLRLAELEKQLKKFKKKLKAVDATLLPYRNPEPTPPQSFFGNVPLHVTEEEEDARYQLDAGFIDTAEYKQILADIGLDPSIEIA